MSMARHDGTGQHTHFNKVNTFLMNATVGWTPPFSLFVAACICLLSYSMLCTYQRLPAPN